MGTALTKLAARVFVPRHKRVTAKGNIIDVEAYWREMTAREREEVKAQMHAPATDRPNSPFDQPDTRPVEDLAPGERAVLEAVQARVRGEKLQALQAKVGDKRKPGYLKGRETAGFEIPAFESEAERRSSLQRIADATGADPALLEAYDEARQATPVDPGFGAPYGGSYFSTPDGQRVRMFRKGQRVRFFDDQGKQVGPEHRNVAPAIVWAASQGWNDEGAPDWLNKRVQAEVQANLVTRQATPDAYAPPSEMGAGREVSEFQPVDPESLRRVRERMDREDVAPEFEVSLHVDGLPISENAYVRKRVQAPSASEAAVQAQRAASQEHGGRRVTIINATPTEPAAPATPSAFAEAESYVRRIRNKAKKRYAQEYLDYLRANGPDSDATPPRDPDDLSYMGAQSVRISLRRFLSDEGVAVDPGRTGPVIGHRAGEPTVRSLEDVDTQLGVMVERLGYVGPLPRTKRGKEYALETGQPDLAAERESQEHWTDEPEWKAAPKVGDRVTIKGPGAGVGTASGIVTRISETGQVTIENPPESSGPLTPRMLKVPSADMTSLEVTEAAPERRSDAEITEALRSIRGEGHAPGDSAVPVKTEPGLGHNRRGWDADGHELTSGTDGIWRHVPSDRMATPGRYGSGFYGTDEEAEQFFGTPPEAPEDPRDAAARRERDLHALLRYTSAIEELRGNGTLTPEVLAEFDWATDDRELLQGLIGQGFVSQADLEDAGYGDLLPGADPRMATETPIGLPPRRFKRGDRVVVTHDQGNESATVIGQTRPARARERTSVRVRFDDGTVSSWPEGRVRRQSGSYSPEEIDRGLQAIRERRARRPEPGEPVEPPTGGVVPRAGRLSPPTRGGAVGPEGFGQPGPNLLIEGVIERARRQGGSLSAEDVTRIAATLGITREQLVDALSSAGITIRG